MKLILPDVYTFTGLLAGRVYAITTGNEITLIDTSITSAAPKILKQLQTAGYQPEQVRRILITHAHSDHVGSLPALQAATGAQVYASTIDTPVVEGREIFTANPNSPLPKPGKPFPGTPVDVQLNDGDTLPDVLGGLQVVFTPGHSPGHIAFWQPEQRLLFGGDVMFHVWGITQPPDAFTVDPAQNRQSIARVEQLQPQVVCFGHGEPLHDAAPAISAFARKLGVI